MSKATRKDIPRRYYLHSNTILEQTYDFYIHNIKKILVYKGD